MIKASPLGINQTCKTFDIPASTFYYQKNRHTKTSNDDHIIQEIRKIKTEFLKYGYRRVTKELCRRGLWINNKKVLRLMKETNLIVKKRRYTPKTTNSRHKLPRYENLLEKALVVQVNQAWVSDITYVKVDDYFTYLALIMDLWSRRIVGWELSREMTTNLTTTALKRAVQLREEDNVKGCIHHSDHGLQYLAHDYMNLLHQYGMLPSMGEVGNSYDNAFAESLNKTIKNEEVWINEYESFTDAYANISQFIRKYNERRLHSSIGYVTPIEFEKEKV